MGGLESTTWSLEDLVRSRTVPTMKQNTLQDPVRVWLDAAVLAARSLDLCGVPEYTVAADVLHRLTETPGAETFGDEELRPLTSRYAEASVRRRRSPAGSAAALTVVNRYPV